jgi:uncharacterized protein DUF5615
MTLRFLADENFDHRTLTGLLRRKPVLDIVSVQEVGLRQADDPTVLDWAAQEGRILLTHDVSTMLNFAYERVGAGLPMPGVFEIPDGTSRSVIIDDLLLIAATSDPDEWRDKVQSLPLR